MAEGSGIFGEDFAGAFKQFLDQANAVAPSKEAPFTKRLRSHFGADPSTLPIIGQDFDITRHPDLQMAIDTFLEHGDGRPVEVVGITAPQFQMDFGVGISQLLAPANTPMALSEGPVEHLDIPLEEGEVATCVQRGLFLVGGEAEKLALLVSRTRHGGLRLEVMAPAREAAEKLLAELRTTMRNRSLYRGRVLSLSQSSMGQLSVNFHQLPAIDRGQIVLPEGLLDRVERHTIGFSRHAEKLLAAGRHLKRGMLLHGPPGTGKTLTAMYLASLMSDRTVMLLKGRGFGLIEHSCAMARMLAPSIVILEDVDLVAEERTRPGASGCTPLLFELLNEMDGLAEDMDVIFLLTTNRPDLLEPALAARPGRVDQAIEIPLPDEGCRRRLFELYGEGLELQLDDMEPFIRRTEGASGAFIRELLRKSAVIAADESDGLVVTDKHLSDAIRELIVEGGDLTKSLLGARTTMGFSSG
ncbi:MAG: ATP-binding protein [Thermoleophilaceae bacterium]|nr:ATP-binding protein [Thermoleophilaceae bacterium]